MDVKAKCFWFQFRWGINWDLQSFWKKKGNPTPIRSWRKYREDTERLQDGTQKIIRAGKRRMKRQAPLSWMGNEELQVIRVLPGLETVHQVCLWSSSIAPKTFFKFHKVIFYKRVAEVHSSGMSQLFTTLLEHLSLPWLCSVASHYHVPEDIAASSADV